MWTALMLADAGALRESAITPAVAVPRDRTKRSSRDIAPDEPSGNDPLLQLVCAFEDL